MRICRTKSSHKFSFKSDKSRAVKNKMYKFMVFCTLLACAASAPTEKATDSLSQEKSLPQHHQIAAVAINSSSVEKREKRENLPEHTSAVDNKRTPALSKQDYEENKPPTFVHPVPVDQIIRNSHVSPQIHSSKHVEAEEDEEEEAKVEEEGSDVSQDEDADQHKHTHNKPSFKPKTHPKSAEDESRETR